MRIFCAHRAQARLRSVRRPLNGRIHQGYLEARRAKDEDGRRLRDEITEKRSEIARLVRRLGEARMTEPPAEVLERLKALGAEVAQAEGRLQAKRPPGPPCPRRRRSAPSFGSIGRLLREAPDPRSAREHIRQHLGGLYLDPDGRLLLEGSDDGLIRTILDSANGGDARHPAPICKPRAHLAFRLTLRKPGE